MSLPYSTATSGKGAMDNLQKILQGFGARSFGFFEDYEEGTLTVQFKYRDERVSVVASSKGYAVALMNHPIRRGRPKMWQEAEALRQGRIAVYSILRDWVKGQVTAVECGILSFHGAFLGQILLPNGETVLDRVSRENIISIAPPA